MKHRIWIVLLGLALLCAVSPADAGGRPDKDWKNFFGHVGAGVLLPQGDLGDVVDDDFYIDGGFTYWPQDWAVGLGVDLGYTQTDISREVINRINDELANVGAGAISGGDVEIWSLSANAIWAPDTNGSVGYYLTAGAGIDFLEGRILDNGLVYYPPVCDPWFWWCIPGGVGPGTFVVLEESTSELGWNVGVGVTFDLDSGSQIFLEARYKSSETDPRASEYVPFVVGFRW